MSDKIEKIVDININIDGDGNLEKVNQGLDNLSKKTEGAVSANNKLRTSNESTKKSVLENGGAMGLLSAATGGLAMDFKDAVEAIELTGVSLKGLRGAIIATGVGALAIILLELVTNWDKWVGVIDGSTAAMEKLNREIEINNTRREKSNLITSKQISDAEQEIRLLEAKGASTADLAKAYEKLDTARQKQAQTDLSTAESNIAKLKEQLNGNKDYLEITKLLNYNLDIQKNLQKGIVTEDARKSGIFNIQEANKLVDGAQRRLDSFKATNEIGKQLLEQEKAKVSAQIALNNAITDPKVRKAQEETANREKQAEEARKNRDDAERKRLENQKAFDSVRLRQIKELQDLEDKLEEEKLNRKKQRELEEINSLKGKSNEELQILRDNVDEKYKILFQELENKRNLEESERKERLRKEEEARQISNSKQLESLIEGFTIEKTLQDAKTEEEIRDVSLKNQIKLDTEKRDALAKAIFLNASEEDLDKIREYYNQKQIENSEETSNALIRIQEVELTAKQEIEQAKAQLTDQGLGILRQLGENSKSLQKASVIADNAVAISRIIQKKNEADAGALATSKLLPIGASEAYYAKAKAFNTLSTVAGIASTVLATNKALKELGGGSASGTNISGGGGDGGAPQAQFDLVQTSSTNQLASRIGQSQNQPVQAFVVGNQVTTQQELDRNRITTATFL